MEGKHATEARNWWGYASVSHNMTEGHQAGKTYSGGGAGVVIYALENSVLLKNPNDPTKTEPGFEQIRSLDSETPEQEKTRLAALSAHKSDWFHGNIVLSIIRQAAPNATICVLRRGTDGKDLSNALQKVITHHQAFHYGKPGLVVCSLGVGVKYDPSNQVIDKPTDIINACFESISQVLKAGLLVVAAAGNSPAKEVTKELREDFEKYAASRDSNLGAKLNATRGLGLPAMHPGVLTVGGYDKDLNCRRFYHGTGVDVYAPAFDVPVPTLEGITQGVLTDKGTSFATPLVAGCIASFLAALPTEGRMRLSSNSAALKQTVIDSAAPIEEAKDRKNSQTGHISTGYHAFKSGPHISDPIRVKNGTQQAPKETEDEELGSTVGNLRTRRPSFGKADDKVAPTGKGARSGSTQRMS
ncbi:peptidase S8/S53 domain-containing protein [Triangularia verruculosa]|uniref:Peptidase S8/S53 domain-containing protein n=1 Tax=Triangularia verruculosa TaxID=2587418 RepID=A0AAN7AZJ6_9PEZI|nr:peptidase S8/S53 domain-containing protein [Triangularia verruculosa]